MHLHTAGVERAFECFEHAALVLGVRIALEVLTLRLEHQHMRLTRRLPGHCNEVGIDPLLSPASQVVLALLPHRHSMPPPQRLLLIKEAGEAAL